MRDRYLEVTYRQGRPLAAYLYLPRATGVRSARTTSAAAGLLVDYGPDGAPIGLEITAPSHTTLELLNRVLGALGHPPLEPADVAPLAAA